MARKPMVTRTMTTTKAKVLCLNLGKKEAFEKEVALPNTFKGEDKLFKAISNVVNSETEKAVQILSSEECETLYGMPEQKFIENASILDPVTRKEIEA